MGLLGDIFDGLGNAASEAFYMMKLVDWVKLPPNQAYESIAEFIAVSPDAIVRKMDRKLFEAAATCLDLYERKRYIKYYVVYKIEEQNKQGDFMGFPKEE